MRRRGFLGLFGSAGLLIGGLDASPIAEKAIADVSADKRIHIKRVFILPFFYQDWGFGWSESSAEELYCREQLGILNALHEIRLDLTNMMTRGKVLVELTPHPDSERSFIVRDGILNARYIRAYDEKDRMVGSVDVCLVNKVLVRDIQL